MLAAAAFLALQDPVLQVDELLREFQAAAQVQEALELLSAQLAALGDAASAPVARRLAEDLRDGMAGAAAPALIAALMGHPEALAPLREAFRDPATSVPGRLELAGALWRLDDETTWRDGVASVLADPDADPEDRLRAAEILIAAGDPRGTEFFSRPGRAADLPLESLVDEPAEPGPPEPAGWPAKKRETSRGDSGTMRAIVLGAVAGLLAALLALRRKG
jgi:hypothetical protein